MKRLAILIFLSVISPGLKAQSTGYSTDSVSMLLDNYLISANNAYRLNGSVLIAQKGKVLLHKAFGLANVATHLPNDTLTRFPVLSLTKSFTATAILKLQEEGKLSVKDKISKYFPDYQYGDKVTIENLLTHSSGINNYTDIVGEEDSGELRDDDAKVFREQVLNLANSVLDDKLDEKKVSLIFESFSNKTNLRGLITNIEVINLLYKDYNW